MTAKGTILPAAVLVVTVMAAAVVATPASAQTSGSFPKYVFQENGTVRIEGDAVTDCRSFAAFLEQGYFESGNISAGAQRVLEQCVEAGLLDPELAASAGAPVSASTSPEAAEASGEDRGLPDTGGPDLPVLLAAAVGATSAGLLLRWARS